MNRTKTRVVAERLGISPAALRAAVDRGKIDRPAFKDCSGDYWWTAEEIAEAQRRLALDLRRAEDRAALGLSLAPQRMA